MNKKMQEVEADIRAAVAAARARGLVLTRGITHDGARCCLLGAFAEGPVDTCGSRDLIGELAERWGLGETDLCDIMGGFDGLYLHATDWTLLGERLARDLLEDRYCEQCLAGQCDCGAFPGGGHYDDCEEMR